MVLSLIDASNQPEIRHRKRNAGRKSLPGTV
jgi:hypothetical protein